MKREIFKLTAKLLEVSDIEHFYREGVPDYYKRIISLELLDGQKLFPEISNKKLKVLPSVEDWINSLVEVGYTFEGAEKDGKRYNNIHVKSIKQKASSEKKIFITFKENQSFTFRKSSIDKNCVAIITAQDEKKALEKVEKLFGENYDTIFTEEEWQEEDIHFFSKGYIKIDSIS